MFDKESFARLLEDLNEVNRRWKELSGSGIYKHHPAVELVLHNGERLRLRLTVPSDEKLLKTVVDDEGQAPRVVLLPYGAVARCEAFEPRSTELGFKTTSGS